MLNTPPKELRENIARAKGYLRRDELPRSLMAMATAMRQYSEVKLMRSARAEIDIQLGEFLNTLIHHQGMQHLLDPNGTGKPRKIPYQQGKELMLATVLEGLARILKQEVEDKSKQEKEARLQRKKNLLHNGVMLLQEGQFGKGRAYLKRAAEEFSEDPDILIQVGQLLQTAKQYADAGEIFEESIAKHPRDVRAYVGAVNCYTAINEFEKCEAVYKAILRTFGGHPNTFGRMALMYLKWGKRIKAEEMATRALQGNAKQPEALQVMEAIGH